MRSTTAAAISLPCVIVTWAPVTPEPRAVRGRAPEEREARRPPRRTHDRELPERHATHPGSERLHRGLLGGEEAGDVLGVGGGRRRPADLAGPEQPLGEPRAVAADRGRDARDLADVDPEADDAGPLGKSVLRRDAVRHGVVPGLGPRLAAPGLDFRDGGPEVQEAHADEEAPEIRGGEEAADGGGRTRDDAEGPEAAPRREAQERPGLEHVEDEEGSQEPRAHDRDAHGRDCRGVREVEPG